MEHGDTRRTDAVAAAGGDEMSATTGDAGYVPVVQADPDLPSPVTDVAQSPLSAEDVHVVTAVAVPSVDSGATDALLGSTTSLALLSTKGSADGAAAKDDMSPAVLEAGKAAAVAGGGAGGGAGEDAPDWVQLPSLWSESVRPVLLQVLRMQLTGTVSLSCLIIILCVVYFGSGFQPQVYTRNLEVMYVDLDGGAVGSALRGALFSIANTTLTVVELSAARIVEVTAGWNVPPVPGALGATPDANVLARIAAAVDAGAAWAAVVARSNATAAWQAALAQGGVYAPAQAAVLTYDEGRNAATVLTFVLPPLRAAVAAASGVLARRALSLVQQNSTAGAATLAAEAVLQPVDVTPLSLHPATAAPVMAMASTLGFLYLWILAGASVGVNMAATMQLEGKVRSKHVLAYRVAYGVSNLGLMSLWITIAIYVFGGHVERGTFVAYWLFNWLVSVAFGSFIALLITLLGPQLAQLAATVFLVLNLAGGGFQHDVLLSNPFFRYGYALPLFNAVMGARTMLYGSFDQIWRNVIILLGWFGAAIAVNVMITRARLVQRFHENVHSHPHGKVVVSMAQGAPNAQTLLLTAS